MMLALLFLTPLGVTMLMCLMFGWCPTGRSAEVHL